MSAGKLIAGVVVWLLCPLLISGAAFGGPCTDATGSICYCEDALGNITGLKYGGSIPDGNPPRQLIVRIGKVTGAPGSRISETQGKHKAAEKGTDGRLYGRATQRKKSDGTKWQSSDKVALLLEGTNPPCDQAIVFDVSISSLSECVDCW